MAASVRYLALGTGLLGGLAVAVALHLGLGQLRAAEAPPGWTMKESVVPGELLRLDGSLRGGPSAWRSGYFQTLSSPRLEGLQQLEARVRVPEGGSLAIWLSDAREGNGAVGLSLSRVSEGPPRGLATHGPTVRPLACRGELAPLGADPVEVAIALTPGGFEATVDGATLTCEEPARGDRVQLAPGLLSVEISDLSLDGVPVPPPGPPFGALWALAGALLGLGLVAGELALGAGAVPVLLTTLPLLLAGLLAGEDLRAWIERVRWTFLGPTLLPALGPLALSLALKALHHASRALREGLPPAGPLRLPAAALVLALAVGATGGSTGLGVTVATAVGGAVLASVGLTLALKTLGSRRPRGAASVLLLLGALGALAVVVLRPHHPLGGAYAALAAALLGLVAWANVNASRVRAFNLVSLVGVGLGLVALEGALTLSSETEAWGAGGSTTEGSEEYGWVRTAERDFEAFEAGVHPEYPESGFPVAFEAEQEGRYRIVSFGGSTTGGAFQNDDLSQFYPAILGAALPPDAEVLNQGVGGWTTFQIRRYLEDRVDDLAPDLATLYVGHNDLLTPTPLPLEQLYAAWQGGGWARGVGDVLGRIHLYQGFRFFVASFASSTTSQAVPLPHAERNLRSVVGLVRDRGGRVLLMSEGLSPDPGPLAEYEELLESLAEEHEGVDYLDVAGALHEAERQGMDIFLDDCHLTATGHRIVARLMLDHLVAQGIAPASSLERLTDPRREAAGRAPAPRHGPRRGPGTPPPPERR